METQKLMLLLLVIIYVTNGYVLKTTVSYYGCGYCDICGTKNYSLSDGKADCEDQTWNNGTKFFNDPLPQNARVTQIALKTTNTIWCGPSNSKVSASFTVGRMGLGTISSNVACVCNNCVPSQTIRSTVYPKGFPGYVYGGVNKIQISVIEGILGVGSLELEITYELDCSQTFPTSNTCPERSYQIGLGSCAQNATVNVNCCCEYGLYPNFPSCNGCTKSVRINNCPANSTPINGLLSCSQQGMKRLNEDICKRNGIYI